MICKRCHAFEDDGKLLEQMQSYLQRMDPEICCADREYESRLMACENCPSLVNGVCRFCGCFVILRAKKKKSTCPAPSGDRWIKCNKMRQRPDIMPATRYSDPKYFLEKEEAE